jgi:hypothetical protein
VVPPEVDGQRRRRRRRVPVRRHGGDQGLVPDGGVGWGCGVDGELLVAGKWGSRCCCCQLRSVAAGEKFGCGTGLLDSFRGLGVGREPIARTIDPWRRSTSSSCGGISGMNGKKRYWGGGIFIISQNFSKSPSILFHPLDSSISQTSP